jgi:hypothetical protein
MRDKPRWLQDMLVSPYKLRRGAEKMELRRFEEDELDLVRTALTTLPLFNTQQS